MISAEELVRLRRSESQEDYLRAATESAAAEVWQDVIGRFPEMRIWVAHNKTVPLEILSILALDEDPAVRAAVAMKNRLSPQLIALLAGDVDEIVRERIAYNKGTPVGILRQLTNDGHEGTSAKARERLRALTGHIMLYLHTGVRAAEGRLRCKQVDFRQRTIRVGRPKTRGGDRRVISLNDEA